MTRQSDNQHVNNTLHNGYDYDNQAWIINGKYVRCGHPQEMNCNCYGRLYEGEEDITHCHLCGSIEENHYCTNESCYEFTKHL